MLNNNELEFLQQSNYIEREMGHIALDDSIIAWQWAKRNRNKINLDYILEIHRLLMQRLRPDIAGKLRDCDVFIGGHRKIFISEALLKTELRDVITTINASNFEKEKDEEFAKHCHVMFEHIHPFQDGNGRIGRILLNVHRIKLGLPILVIDESKKYEYYKWFS